MSNTPAAIQPNFEVIRTRLAPHLTRWVGWRYERDGERWKKPPILGVRGKLGPIDISKKAGISLDDIETFYRSHGDEVAGVGVIMKGEPGIIGLDLDKCLDESGAVVSSAVPLVDSLLAIGSYVEVSPSGHGLRCFVKGSKPAGAKQKAVTFGHSVEAYGEADGRYLTVTGKPWGAGEARPVVENPKGLGLWLSLAGLLSTGDTVGKVAEQDDGLPAISDEDLVRKIKQAGQGTGKRLFEGSTENYAGDRSAADLALCRYAARWSSNHSQIERVWRTSGLWREKAEKRREYRISTIEKALTSASEVREKAAAEKAKIMEQAGAVNEYMAGGMVDMVTDSKGRIQPTLANVALILMRDHQLAGLIYFDEFAGLVRRGRDIGSALGDDTVGCRPAGGVWEDADDLALVTWLSRKYRLTTNDETVARAVQRAAMSLAVNPIKERLESLVWDGKPRLRTWLRDYLGAMGDEGKDYRDTVGERFLVGAVARAYQPGCKMDTMLVLVGTQGARKSTAVRVLAEAVDTSCFLESFALRHGGDFQDLLALRGKLVAEWGELSGFSRHESEAVKDFLSRREDTYKDPYARRTNTRPRTCVFFGTTNSTSFLRDPTGNRRYWVIEVGAVDIELLKQDAEQLWAEAVSKYKAGARWWIDERLPEDKAAARAAASASQSRMVGDAYDDMILDGIEKEIGGGVDYTVGLSLGELWSSFAGLPVDAMMREQHKFVDALKRCGFEKSRGAAGRTWRLSGERAVQILRAIEGH